MKKFEVTIDIIDKTYTNRLIIALVHQGYAVYYNDELQKVCFTATEEEITELPIISDKLTEDNETKMKITHPADDINRKSCSFCHKKFEEDEEKINTCTHTEYVTLCRPCYDKAGNSVR